MRLAGLTAALTLFAAAAAAAQPVAPLAPNEVLLELDATGAVKSRPDVTRLFVSVKSSGETAAKARAANAAVIERITAAARSAGVATTDIRPGSGPWWRAGFIGNELHEGVLPALVRPAAKTETALLEIRIADPARAAAVRTAVEEAGADQVLGPLYELEDDAVARRAAKEAAVSSARAQAEDYARALGMRVARLLRVSERVGPSGNPEDMEAMFATMYGVGAPAGQIETKVRVAVDFALAPGR